MLQTVLSKQIGAAIRGKSHNDARAVRGKEKKNMQLVLSALTKDPNNLSTDELEA